MMGEG